MPRQNNGLSRKHSIIENDYTVFNYSYMDVTQDLFEMQDLTVTIIKILTQYLLTVDILINFYREFLGILGKYSLIKNCC